MPEVPNFKQYVNSLGVSLGGGESGDGPSLHFYESPEAWQEALEAMPGGGNQYDREAIWKTGDLVLYGNGFETHEQGLYEVTDWATYGYNMNKYVKQSDVPQTYHQVSDMAELVSSFVNRPEIQPGHHVVIYDDADRRVFLRCHISTDETQNGDTVVDEFYLELASGERVEALVQD